MSRGRCIAVAVSVVLAVSACSQPSDGIAVATSSGVAPNAATSTTDAATSAPTSESASASSEVPGVVPTSPDRIPPNALICMPTPAGTGEATRASVSDPAAPRITITVPEGWSSTPGQGSTALTLTGPEGTSGEVTIVKTDLEPAEAFTQYNDELFARSDFSVVNTLPAEFCGFSGQRLFGTWADAPGEGIDFANRITHIWTNTGNYLVTIHLQGPNTSADLAAAKDTLLADFPIVIP
ncbi:LpqN/LpqT family lipoprotein [Mycolicibacterium confluentis]|nr:LpqN/LpqT family lipoprotein [Mycolicibacterium confluentis]